LRERGLSDEEKKDERQEESKAERARQRRCLA